MWFYNILSKSPGHKEKITDANSVKIISSINTSSLMNIHEVGWSDSLKGYVLAVCQAVHSSFKQYKYYCSSLMNIHEVGWSDSLKGCVLAVYQAVHSSLW